MFLNTNFKMISSFVLLNAKPGICQIMNNLLQASINPDEKFGQLSKNNQSNGLEEDIYKHDMVTVPLWYYTSFCVILTSVGINGGLLNGLVIRMFLKNSYIQTPYNNIILNLAFAEFLMAIVGVPHDIVALIQGGWKLGKLMCVSTGAIVTSCGFVSILTISTLSVCRYESILQFDKSYEKVTSHKTSLSIICIIWLYSFSISVPPLLGWGRYVPEVSGLGCVPDWYSKDMSFTYFSYMFIFGFFIPTSVIIVSSILTCSEARDLNKFIEVFVNKKIRLVKYRAIQKHFRLVLSMNSAYLLCWGTYVFFCFSRMFISDIQLGQMVSMLPTIAIKLNVCINPILYIAFNPHFRGPITGRMIRNEKRKDMILKRATQVKKNEAAKKAKKDGEFDNSPPLFGIEMIQNEKRKDMLLKRATQIKKNETTEKGKEEEKFEDSLRPLKLILKELELEDSRITLQYVQYVKRNVDR